MVKPLLLIIAISGIILGVQYRYAFFSITILGLLLLKLVDLWEKREAVRLLKEKLRKKWGRDHIEKRNFSSIVRYYKFSKDKSHGEFILDDITWRDLNLDSVFNKVDHTKSLPGMQKLYHILRKPLFDEKDLKSRNKKINSFLKEKKTSQEIQYPLYLLGKEDSKYIFTYFEEGMDIETKYLLIYRIFSFLPILALILFFINDGLALFIFVAGVSINGYIYQKNKERVYIELDTFKYISSLIKTAKDIVKLETGSVDIEREELEDLLKATRRIYKNVASLNTNSSSKSELQILIDYFNILILRETIIFYKTVKLLNKHKKDILEIYKKIGKIDAYISIASYKDGLDFYTEPNLLKDNSKFYLKVKDLYHPLLDDPVPYTFELDNKGALVTGSNASGKSTYLRTIGINTVLAQTFFIALAKEYDSNYYRLLTSIGTTDSIEEGDSYFMAEAKSLKRIVDSLEGNAPVLCILDEIFRGTNTAERISAAREVLNYMIDRNTLVVAATHDLELTSIVNDNFHNYHFKEDIEEHDITFDYILRRGPATSRNAIAILRYLGYPKLIYENADKTVEEYTYAIGTHNK